VIRSDFTAVPEPGTLALSGLTLVVGVAAARLRRNRAAA
jgi:hypothetical protein